jgi:hypothetical protein
MARKRKDLAKAAAALIATALVETVITKASEDPRIRRKAKAAGKALKKRATSARKKIVKAVRKRLPKRPPAASGRARVSKRAPARA